MDQHYRTDYDKVYQKLFCPDGCDRPHVPHHPPKPEPAPQPAGKPFSYACSPGIGCHMLQQEPGKDESGTRYSNLEECSKNCQH